MLRTRTAGSLRAGDIGTTVTLTGWVGRRRDHGGVAFLDLRDASGVAQVVVRDEQVAHGLRAEYCLRVTGTVQAPPRGQREPEPRRPARSRSWPTRSRSLNAAGAAAVPDRRPRRRRRGGAAAAPLPRPAPHRPGQRAAAAVEGEPGGPRRVLDAHEFVEIETPTLTRSTPEGARDFLVPGAARARAPGTPCRRAPQLFKQLLMVAGMERYYQIARCYRDEDFRADRQPEFTQLDIEMSFVDQDDVIALAEEVLDALWKLVDVELPTPIPRMTYAEAMARYGSDKPDLRFGLELVELHGRTSPAPRSASSRRRTSAPSSCPAGRPSRVGSSTRGRSGPSSAARAGWRTSLVGEDGDARRARSPRTCPRTSVAGLAEHTGAEPGDCVFFAAGEPKSSRALLGAARVEIARRGRPIDEDAWAFVWVVDAPLFEPAVRGRRPATSRSVRRLDRGAPRLHVPEAGVDRHGSRRRPARPWPTPTTSSATATRSAAARSVSTAATCRSASSR